jgi:RNA ligase
MRHPAHLLDFDTLLGGLNSAIADGLVYERRDGDLSLFCYTTRARYEEIWTVITSVARGLVLDRKARRIVATPFAKFYNLGEGGREAPALPFEAFEKLDGSMVIAFYHGEGWRTATKGEFKTNQAKAGFSMLPFDRMEPGTTYLSELVGPSNKIVVRYPKDECRLIGAYASDGREFLRNELEALKLGGMPLARIVSCSTLSDLIAKTETLSIGEEGYVLRFSDGTRLKLKGKEYRRLHALISDLSPLTVWDAMVAGNELEMRRELPEEFWDDFDQIRSILKRNIDGIMSAIEAEAQKWTGVSDKELGLAKNSIPEPTRSFLFSYRKGLMEAPRTRQSLYRLIRPLGNVLDGYVASYAMKRASEELSG